MSTLTLSPRIVPGEVVPGGLVGTARRRRATSPPRRGVRLTRRGRVVFLLGFLAVIAVLMVALGPVATATFTSGRPEPVRIVQVEPGDTLYGIAGQVAEPGKIREMVAHIEQLNSLDGPALQVGQRIAVPKG